jgi:acid phosphatase (class A)
LKTLNQILVLFATLLALAACGSLKQTQNPSPATAPPQNSKKTPALSGGLYFLSEDAIPVASAINAPFPSGSVADRAELDQILQLQLSRTSDECRRANTEASVSLDTFFGPAYGPLTTAEVLAWSSFFDKIGSDANDFIKQEKALWHRERPYVEDTAIQPCVPLAGQLDSYPSGHAALSRVYADVLDVIDSRRKTQFDARAAQVAQDRVLGGVHHTSDIEAGKTLGDLIFKALETSDAFQREIRALPASSAAQ